MTHTLTESDLLSVQAVLSHWFDGDQHVNYKTKWFPEGSTGLQAIADHEVNTKFGSLFSEALDRKLHNWQCETKSCVALIIVLDQFSRHICRLHGKELMQDKQKLADELALDVAQRLHSSEEKTLGLSIPEYVFSLMPLRHTATVDHLSHVLECLQKKERVEEKSMELLNRFRKQTTRRLQHLQDREKVIFRICCRRHTWKILFPVQEPPNPPNYTDNNLHISYLTILICALIFLILSWRPLLIFSKEKPS